MSSSPKEYVVEVRALAKLVLHSLKYPHATVTGVLLAGRDKKHAGDDKKNLDHNIRIVDCVPFTHLNHGLTPVLEVGLLQTSAYASKHNLQIIAFYQANANFHDVEPDSFAQKVGEKLLEFSDQSLILMLQEESLANFLASEVVEQVLVPFTLADGKWKNEKQINVRVEKKDLQAVRDMIFDRQLHAKLYDFDNHLDDLKCNWLNPHLHSVIEDCVSTSQDS